MGGTLPVASIGGRALYPSFTIACRFGLFLNLEKILYLFRTPLQFQLKSGYNHQGTKFRDVAPQYFVFLHIGFPPPPGNSSSRDFSQYSQLCLPIKCPIIVYIQNAPPPNSKKSGYNHKGSKFRGVDTQYCVFFSYWEETTPL